jgi:XTP/dITP diphosphohydrolase
MSSAQPTRLLIATGNPGKMREYSELLSGISFELVSLKDLGITHEVDETGDTFEENAWLKASEYAALSGLLTLADDSGLEVDALGGEPGVRSARYGGDACQSDGDRVNLLLKNLEDVPWDERTARFRCVIAVAKSPLAPLYPNLNREGEQASHFSKGRLEGDAAPALITQAEGSVDGMIQYSPQGDDGFGYDPVFFIPSRDRTLAQISLAEKNQFSHRGNAAKIVVESLKKLIFDS